MPNNNNKIQIIRKREPDNPMQEQKKQQIVEQYSDTSHQIQVETTFNHKNKNGEYFGRLDIDTFFHDIDNRFNGHYYTKIYISEQPVGPTKFLDTDSVVWQINAGLYQEIQGATLGDGFMRKQIQRNKYIDSGIVVSWKAPVADLYYNSEKTNLKIGTRYIYEHDLMLKRRFPDDQKNYDDLFVWGKSLFDEGAVDPFLIKVLREKQSRHELGDIIKTIQSNQNMIIRQPLMDNLVVQGCAGSGKTMIMLHRLSYLLYNNPNLEISKIKILTPNELFNMHISDLSQTLELNYVDRLTVEQYYAQLILGFYPDLLEQHTHKINDGMELSYIDYIYSDQFKVDMENEYQQWIQHISELINEEKLRLISNKYKLRYSLYDSRLADIGMVKYSNIVEKIRSNLQEKSKIAKNAANRKQKLITHISTLISKTCEINDRLNKMAMIINAQIRVLNSQMKAINYKIPAFPKNELASEHASIKEQQSILEDNLDNTRKLLLKNQNAMQICTEMDLESKSLADKIEKVYDFQLMEYEEDLKGYLARNIHDINTGVSRVSWLANRIIKTTNEKSNEMVDHILKLTKNIKGLVPSVDMILNIRNNGLDIQDEDIDILYFAEKTLQQNTVKNVFDAIIAKLIETRFPGRFVAMTSVYRFELYAKLCFCLLYYGLPINADRMLFIDEGQDLALNEYKLLSHLNGDNVIFNIFGDTNQLIKPGQGIEDWIVLNDFDAKRFTINENYRNTNEITTFCNQVFGYDALPVGLFGQTVISMSIEEMTTSLINRKNRLARVAIILKPEEETRVAYSLEKSGILFKIDEIESGLVSVIEIGKSKGLEFDVVYVLPDNMSKNEKYIAFTRALSELIIVK